MIQEIPISEARQNLSKLMKKLQKNMDLTVRITLNGIPVGDLTAPQRIQQKMNSGEALLKALKNVGPPEVKAPPGFSVAEEHDRFLYNK